MYDYLKGQVTRITPEYIALEVQGIGYQLYTPNPFAFRINNQCQQIYVHMHVREDAQTLFGPMPDTNINLRNNSRCSKLVKPNNVCASSRTCICT